MSIQHILEDCGLTISRFEQVYGGDINRAYCLYCAGAKYFLKVNDAKRFPGMFSKEVNGLLALNEHTALIVPEVIKSGVTHGEQYLLLEWMERGTPQKGFWQNFGAELALMHQNQQPFFGWKEDNFIGSLVQQNQRHSSWHSLYTECRIMPLVTTLFNSTLFSGQDLVAAELFCKKIENLFPAEPPAILHGDLWSGNYMVTATGYAAIFDPAVYFGHREMDIGMTRLFGGFERSFYDAYNEVYPLERGWEHRLPIVQLYPILVHAVLFGGHYVDWARGILKTDI